MDEAYIAACELCGPNAPEFEQVLAAEERKSMLKLRSKLKELVWAENRKKAISEAVTEQAFAHLNEMTYE